MRELKGTKNINFMSMAVKDTYRTHIKVLHTINYFHIDSNKWCTVRIEEDESGQMIVKDSIDIDGKALPEKPNQSGAIAWFFRKTRHPRKQ